MRRAEPIALFGLVVALGCGDNLPIGELPLHPVPGCEAINPAACDVRMLQCQTRLLSLAACLRGDQPGALPMITVMSEAAYAAYMNDLVATWTPSPNRARWERAFNLVGLVQSGAFSPSTYVAESVKFFWGLYRPDTKDILIIDHGKDFNDQSASTVLIHEFIHALQDRAVDLGAFVDAHSASDDAWMAAGAMIEGEARFHETRYWASANGLDPADIDWTRRFQESLMFSEGWVIKEPSPYSAARRTFPYQWGARYMHFTWQVGGVEAIGRRFASPPSDTRTLMASVNGALEPGAAPATVVAATAPPEWSLLADTTVGAWGMFLLLAKHAENLDRARELALGWRADGFFVFGDAGTSTTLVWRTEFADEETAKAVADIASTGLGAASVRRLGVGVVIAKTDAAFQTLDWAFVP